MMISLCSYHRTILVVYDFRVAEFSDITFPTVCSPGDELDAASNISNSDLGLSWGEGNLSCLLLALPFKAHSARTITP